MAVVHGEDVDVAGGGGRGAFCCYEDGGGGGVEADFGGGVGGAEGWGLRFQVFKGAEGAQVLQTRIWGDGEAGYAVFGAAVYDAGYRVYV